MPTFPISATGALRDALNEIPENARKFARRGIRVLSDLPADDSLKVLDLLIEDFHKGGSRMDPEIIAKQFEIGERGARNLTFAVAMIAGFLSAREENADEFIAASIESGIVDDQDAARTLEVVNHLIERKDALSEAIERETLASSLLPSLVLFKIVVDVRVGFENDEIRRLIPVAVATVDTDEDNQQLWFQMTKSQLITMRDRLSQSISQIDSIDDWISQKEVQ